MEEVILPWTENVSSLMNLSLDMSLFERFASNRRVGSAAFYSLIISYCVLIIMGTTGNLLVVYVVVRKPAMRTTRNVFIINLAVSDMLLCLITMPLTLMEILSNSWPLGESAVSCKMVGSLQAVSIFVSTMSITAIALDRYQLIVYPTQASCQRAGALAVLAAIWLISALLAAPLFIWRTLEHHDIPYPNSPIQSVDYCFENWPGQGRAWYSAASIVIQYALPIVTVSIAHVRIYYKLRYRLTSMTATFKDPNKQIREDLRLRKTNQLLIAIAIIFGICWMPLNIFNVVVDSSNVFGDDTEAMFVIYGICHMFGMSSACANPLLYGWLNDNFRKEFREIGLTCWRSPTSGDTLDTSRSMIRKLRPSIPSLSPTPQPLNRSLARVNDMNQTIIPVETSVKCSPSIVRGANHVTEIV